MTLLRSSYGKGRVRVMRVDRASGVHVPRELTIRAMLTGDFGRAYTDADNATTVSTDTIKNVVNVVARENVALEAEPFCEALAARLLGLYAQAGTATVEAEEHRWVRAAPGGVPHAHGFVRDANGSATVRTVATRGATGMAFETRSGISGFTFMKTTASGWSGFYKDAYTTLRETDDRIAATSMVAEWGWRDRPGCYDDARAALIEAMLGVFLGTFSASIQDSLYRMGRAALDAVPAISEISLACPNKHYIPINLEAFGLDNPNAVFIATDEPHGQIECTVGR